MVACGLLSLNLLSSTEDTCAVCALYSEVDLPSWVKAVASGPSVDAHEEVHTLMCVSCYYLVVQWHVHWNTLIRLS